MYVGIDIGYTKIAIGLVSDKGELSFQSSLPLDSERDSDSLIRDIIYIIKSISDTIPLSLFNDRLLGVGIGIPDALNRSNDKVVEGSNFKWESTPLREMIQAYFNIPVFVENHGLTATLAEHEIGYLKGTVNLQGENFLKDIRDTRIVSSNLGKEAGVIGAALLCKYLK